MDLFKLAKDYNGISPNIKFSPFSHNEKRKFASSEFFLTKPIAEALLMFETTTISKIIQTADGKVFIDCVSINTSNAYQILFAPGRIPIIQIYSLNKRIKFVDFLKTEEINILFLPLIVADYRQDKTFFDLFKKYRKICSNKEAFPTFDTEKEKEIFFSINNFFYDKHQDTDYIIINEPITSSHIVEPVVDLTEEFLRKNNIVSELVLYKEPEKEPEKEPDKEPDKEPKKEPTKLKNTFSGLTEEMKNRIPVLPEWLKVPEEMIPIEKSILSGKVISFLQIGPAGGGKTTNCKLICRDIGLPLMAVVNCTNNLDEFILGKFIPKGNEFIFFKSEVSEAIEKGGAVVFEEINFGNPKQMSFLNSLLDDNGFVRLDNGEVIKRHPNFRFFATMNYGYLGTSELSKSLFNRFNCRIRIKDLSNSQIADLIKSANPDLETDVISKITSVYRKIQIKLKEEEREEIISPRDILNWVSQIENSNLIESARHTVCMISESDEQLDDEILDIVKMYF